jgi:hypothetical protein
MEIVLQLLDELDDIVFTLASFWRTFCRIGLALGLAAAIVLTPIYGTELRLPALIVLTTVAGGSVLAWLAAALVTIRYANSQALSAA